MRYYSHGLYLVSISLVWGCFSSVPMDEDPSDPADSALPPTEGTDLPETPEKANETGATAFVAPASDTEGAVSRIPEAHRAKSEICDSVREVPEPTYQHEYNECTAHADCKEGENGRCEIGNWWDDYLKCTYDLCFKDGDCEAGKICQCGGDAANRCYAEGNCRTDADCGRNGYCSPTLGSCGHYSGPVGYYCHTPDDECVNDADCADQFEYGGYCAYNKVSGHWSCSDAECDG